MRSAWKTRVAGWILSLGLRPTSASIDFGEVARGGERPLGGRFSIIRAMRPACRSSPKKTEDAGEIAGLEAVDDFGRTHPGLGHPHVERTFGAEGKAALGLVELHRGNADVEHHAVCRVDIVVEPREWALDEAQSPL